MSKRGTKAHWEQVYTDRLATEVSWYQAYPRISLNWIRQVAPAPQASVIDVGGGASRLVDELLKRGYRHLAVLDIAGAALAVARARLGKRAAHVAWYESDVTRFVSPRQFDVWHDRAVFHFLTEAEDRRAYIEALRLALRPGGTLIIAAFAPDGPPQCSGLDVRHYDAQKIQTELGPDFQLCEEAAERHVTPAGKMQSFMYFRLRRVDGQH